MSKRRKISKQKTKGPFICSPANVDLLENRRHKYFGFCVNTAFSEDHLEEISYIVKFTHFRKSPIGTALYLKSDPLERYFGPSIGYPENFAYSITSKDVQGFSCSAKYIKKLLAQKIIRAASNV